MPTRPMGAKGSKGAVDRLDALPDLAFVVGRDGRPVDPAAAVAGANKRGVRELLPALAEHLAIYAPRAIDTGSLQSFLTRLSPDGRMRDYETRVARINGREALAIVRDISDWARTEEELQLFLGITLTVPETADFRSALGVVLRMVCESTGWVLGQAWTATPDGSRIECLAAFDSSPRPLATFRQASRRASFRRGEGLPGVVWESGRAQWIPNIANEPNFPRVAPAEADGLRTAFAVPVLADREVVAVLEFFAFAPRDEDARLITTISAVAEQLGSLLKQKRSEESLRLLDSAVKQMNEALVIATADEAGGPPHIGFVSPAFTRMTGVEAHALMERGLDALAGKDGEAAITTCVASVFSDSVVLECESVQMRPDGHAIPLEWRMAPVVDAAGRISHVVAIVRDITQRRQIEQSRIQLQLILESAAQQWRETFDAIESPIFLVDRAAAITRMNDAAKALAGASYGELLQRAFIEVGEGEPWLLGGEVIARTLATRAPVSLSTRDDKTGRSWQIDGTLASLNDDARVILVVRETTRVVQLQESLRRSETMSAMGSLVAGVAHEVRNPLHAITATLDALERRFGAREELQPHLRVLRGEVGLLTELTHDLLAYGRPANPQFFEGRLRDVIAQATSACSAEAERLRVVIAADVPAELPTLRMDPTRLSQVFTNLLANAIQHSPEGGVVRIDAKASRDPGPSHRMWVECAVRDDGPGFARADLPRVFEPFFSRRRGGTGLGLSIVQRMVEEHDGSVVAGNRPEGGAIVVVRLPASS